MSKNIFFRNQDKQNHIQVSYSTLFVYLKGAKLDSLLSLEMQLKLVYASPTENKQHNNFGQKHFHQKLDFCFLHFSKSILTRDWKQITRNRLFRTCFCLCLCFLSLFVSVSFILCFLSLCQILLLLS